MVDTQTSDRAVPEHDSQSTTTGLFCFERPIACCNAFVAMSSSRLMKNGTVHAIAGVQLAMTSALRAPAAGRMNN
eukprot:4364756-Pleurochrysis_carterae.AAC.2